MAVPPVLPEGVDSQDWGLEDPAKYLASKTRGKEVAEEIVRLIEEKVMTL